MNVACLERFTSDFVIGLTPGANKTYIRRYWPIVYMALDENGLDYDEMVLMTLGTIAAETGNFNITVREYVSRYNTTPEGRRRKHYFDKYDDREDLGNRGKPDGYEYRGGGLSSSPDAITSEWWVKSSEYHLRINPILSKIRSYRQEHSHSILKARRCG